MRFFLTQNPLAAVADGSNFLVLARVDSTSPFPANGAMLVYHSDTNSVSFDPIPDTIVTASASQFTVTSVSGNHVIKRGEDPTPGSDYFNELVISCNQNNSNVLALRNTSAGGWSAMTFRDRLNLERGAIGYANDGVPFPSYVGRTYFESNDQDNGAGARSGEIVISQGSTFGGTRSKGPYIRQVFYKNGEVAFHRVGTSTDEGDLTKIFSLDPNLGILRLGAGTGNNGYGVVKADDNHAIYLRTDGNAGSGTNDYWASDSHRFWGDGLLTNATAKLLFVVGAKVNQSNVPMKFTPQLKATLPAASGGVEGSIAYVFDATGGKCIAYCDGTNWKNLVTGANV